MNRSIDLLEELAAQSRNVFNLNRRGYLYLTAQPEKIPSMHAAAMESASLGAGELRVHDGKSGDRAYFPAYPSTIEGQPEGADLLLDQRLIRAHFPYLSDRVIAALHVRRAGWFSAQQLGAYLLDRLPSTEVRRIRGRVTAIHTQSGRVSGVCLADGTFLQAGIVVLAAGPHLEKAGRMLDVQLPVHCELHLKVAFRDDLAAVPRDAPLLIWTDTQRLPWSEEEQAYLQEDPPSRWLLDEFPAGVHTRPEGGEDSPMALILWEYRTQPVDPVFPVPMDLEYPEIALRGLSTMLPALSAYFGRLPRPILDGGYYTKTQENRPLIGPLPVEGAFVLGALSGYGLMASQAAGELLAAHVAGRQLPQYAAAFDLRRYDDPAYQQLLRNWGASGQL
jgi:glycine/D-amino acid oxidase-like deaminating enzyme